MRPSWPASSRNVPPTPGSSTGCEEAAPRAPGTTGRRPTVAEVAQAVLAGLVIVEARPRAPAPFAADVLDPAGASLLVARHSYGQGPIVVAFDFSEPSYAAVSTARALARRLDAPVVALHALGCGGEPAIGHAAEVSRQILAAVGGSIEVRVVSGAPEYALLGAERELAARLLVVGAGAEPLGAGTLAVVAAATGPVLVTR